MKKSYKLLKLEKSSKLYRLIRAKLAACLLFSFMPLALAQVVWSPIASNQNFEVGIDFDSLRFSNGVAKFRIKTTDKSDRSIMYEDLEIDCQVKRARNIWAKKYDWRNKVRGVNTTPGSWDLVQPNTIMSIIYAQACVNSKIK